MTASTTNRHDDSAERGRQATLDAEAALRARRLEDPDFRARQPTESELQELASMDASEEEARAAIAEAVREVERLGRITPADAVDDRPRFDLSGILRPNRDPGNWADARDVEDQRAAGKAAWKAAIARVHELREDEATLRTANNSRRRAISEAGQRRAMGGGSR